MPAADDCYDPAMLTPDELLGGMAYYAAASAPRADDTDLDAELVKLLAEARQGQPANDEPTPGW